MMKAIDIINESKQEFSKKKIIIIANTGKEYELLIQEKLNETTVAEIVADLIDRSNFCKQREMDFNIVQNIYLLLIKYFTDIKFSKSKSFEKEYSEDLQLINALIDLGLFEQIFKNFNEESLKKVVELFETYAKQMKSITQNQVEKEVIIDDIEGI